MPKTTNINPNKELGHLKRGTRSKKFKCMDCGTKFKSMFFRIADDNFAHEDCPICGADCIQTNVDDVVE